ncbi:putative NRPS-like protein biosynthetic cluster [Steccherinum ochraceum]|uniref:Putative NRPS-like protein biosynthetic cluster n=1 Tax=Steccherinum ochraceum TaxID=92696 RepID=A0A4R0RGV9_9APHY|nr:putative NRPS-like protein biosynthetic cluster [Steccherinum ochraceum]
MSLFVTTHKRGVSFPAHLVPKTQALSSKTFKIPPLDGSLTLPEIWDWHLENSPEHPLFVYVDENGTEKSLIFRDAIYAMHRAGRIMRSRMPESLAETRPLVAILAVSDAITYFLVETGLMRANFVFFPISPRNSPAAVAHLLTQTSADHVLVGPQPAMQNLVKAALGHIQTSGARVPSTSIMPSFDDLVKPELEPNFEFLPRYNFHADDDSSYFHSSGSSAFPKPRLSWHARYVSLGFIPYFGALDVTGLRVGHFTIPMFHGWGGMLVAWMASAGITLCCFGPKNHTVLPTPEATLKAILATKSEMAFTVPSIIEAWSKSAEDVQALKQISKGIVFGGGPLDKAVGDQLTEQGVILLNSYGSTELGLASKTIPPYFGKDWEYVTFDDSNLKVHWEHQGDGTAELVALVSDFLSPSGLNTTVNGEPAYATSDLFIPHPTRPGLWKLFGRTDDQIMHSTGEKTNPVPLEAMLNQDPNVGRCVMFGRGQFNAGVLVEPQVSQRFDPSDTEKLAAYRNKIWPTVEQMNAYAPQHSRIFKEMIMVTSPDKPFSYTAKNTARRQAIIKEYESEIEALYAAAADSTQAGDLSPPDAWDVSSTVDLIRLIVGRVVKTPLADRDDFFQKGCDSLQATWIRNSILHALRQSSAVETRKIPNNFVYQNPTIQSLGEYISALVQLGFKADEKITEAPDTTASVAAMHKMVEQYRQNLPKHIPSAPIPTKDTVLVTGTTGSLGCIVLAKLLAAPEVEHVYAMNRVHEEGKALIDRQKERLAEWGVDPEIVNSPKLTFLETDLSAERLGLPADTYDKLRHSVTHIIHNAYRVNFNLSLSSFEPNIRGVRQLIDMALTSSLAVPPRLIFVSSVGVLGRRHPGDVTSTPVNEEPVDPSLAVSTGYAESKWVIERLLSIAEEETVLRPVTVRVGQLAGGASGAWNRAEWFPSLVKSSLYLGSLPSLDQVVSWIPADKAAQALVEMRNSKYPILHLSHPRPVPWSNIISPISRALNLPVVPYAEWFAKLQKSGEGLSAQMEAEALKNNPALGLLPFFSSVNTQASSGEAMGLRSMETTKAQEVAVSLSENTLPRLSEADVLKWLAYW